MTKALKVMELVSPSPAVGTEEGGLPYTRWTLGRKLGTEWACWSCPWKGRLDDLFDHHIKEHL